MYIFKYTHTLHKLIGKICYKYQFSLFQRVLDKKKSKKIYSKNMKNKPTRCEYCKMHRFSPSLRGNDGQLSEFIDGLGPGQLVGRQVLGAPSLGDIQLSMCHQKGFLEVEVIRARGLQVQKNVNLLKNQQLNF